MLVQGAALDRPHVEPIYGSVFNSCQGFLFMFFQDFQVATKQKLIGQGIQYHLIGNAFYRRLPKCMSEIPFINVAAVQGEMDQV